MKGDLHDSDLLRLPGDVESVRAARDFVRTALRVQEVDEDHIESAVLLTSELATNAVLHANTDIEVGVFAAPPVRIQVRDFGEGRPRKRARTEESVLGRGLELVEMLASSFGVDRHPDGGKMVWFEIGAEMSGGSWEAVRTSQEASVTVSLQRFPVSLYRVLREQNEGLVREYMLHIIGGTTDADLTVGQINRAESARATLFDGLLSAFDATDYDSTTSHVDVDVEVRQSDLEDFTLLSRVLAEADRLATDNRLLSRPTLPELKELRQWCLDEVRTQFAGGTPTPWNYVDLADVVVAPTSHGFDLRWVETTHEPVIVGNADNHIIAASLAAARPLGYEPHELVGSRIATIVPPNLREAHVAGFSRHIVTGRTSIMKKTVPSEALHKNGSTVKLWLRLERHGSDQAYYFVAQIIFDAGDTSAP